MTKPGAVRPDKGCPGFLFPWFVSFYRFNEKQTPAGVIKMG
ncbi:MAG TPA: hypothetical protein PK492_04890 [Chitinophagaceae bacterium]|nr:hypothetical protein [Chitinophagaceae bacterium]HNC38676.1 hypothetical protein [Chitinophagaceae bacterium]